MSSIKIYSVEQKKYPARSTAEVGSPRALNTLFREEHNQKTIDIKSKSFKEFAAKKYPKIPTCHYLMTPRTH